MEATFAVVYFAVIFAASLQVVPVLGDGTDPASDMEEMRAMLTNTLKTNKKLELQNIRLMRIRSELGLLCSQLNLSPVDVTSTDEDDTTLMFERKDSVELSTGITLKSLKPSESNDHDKGTITKTVGDLDPPLHIQSVRSSRNNHNNALVLTLNYTAPEDHSTDWWARLDNNGQLRSAGNRRYLSQSLYTVYEFFYSPEALQAIDFRLHAGNTSVHLQFKISAINVDGEQTLPLYPGDIIFSNQRYFADDDSDLEISAISPQPFSSDEFHSDSVVFFSGINNTVYPLEMFKYSNEDGDVISVTENNSKGNSSLNITIKSSYARHGGILTVRIPIVVNIRSYVLTLNYERDMTIASSRTGDVIEGGNVALFPLDKETAIASESYSLWCAATGNPTPEVKLLRQLGNGQTEAKKTHAVLTSRFTTIVTFTLTFNDKMEGLYICSATSGNHTVEEATEVSFYKPIEFSMNSSKVSTNNSEGIRILCRASGIPRPEVEFHIRNPEGPELSEWTKNFVNNTAETFKSTTIVAVITKHVAKWPGIFCVGKQRSLNKTAYVEIFPAVTSSP